MRGNVRGRDGEERGREGSDGRVKEGGKRGLGLGNWG